MKKILGIYIMTLSTAAFMFIMFLIARYILIPLCPIIGNWGVIGLVIFVFPLIFMVILNLIEKIINLFSWQEK